MLKIFIIAGEASGDVLGAKLISAIQDSTDKEILFSGVGGDRMKSTGFKSLFPMEELSLLGFLEIIPHIPKLLRYINQTVEEILKLKPDVVVTIDSPGFNFRIAKKLQGRGVKLVHYVAPTVWAYKPERAAKIAKLYDHLLLLLPFEAPYFEKEGLPCTFIGHPIFEENFTGDGNSFREKHNLDSPVLSIMPASRKSELKRLLPIFSKTVSLLKKDFPNLNVIILATERFREELVLRTKKWNCKTTVVSKEKNDALDATTVALVKSGTGTLEVAIAGVPMVVAYRVNPLSAWILRRMMRVEFVNLINIILNKPAIPELLQDECTAQNLAENLKFLLNNKNARSKQLEEINTALNLMGRELSPSKKAANVILKLIGVKNIKELTEHDSDQKHYARTNKEDAISSGNTDSSDETEADAAKELEIEEPELEIEQEISLMDQLLEGIELVGLAGVTGDHAREILAPLDGMAEGHEQMKIEQQKEQMQHSLGAAKKGGP